MEVIASKILLAIATALLGGWVVRRPALPTISPRKFLGLALSLQVLPAALLFVALYVVAGQPVSSDVPGFYVPPSHAVLAGQIPYRDFGLSYAPLFPYVGASLLYIWDADKAFVLFGIAMNALTLILWHEVALRCTSVTRARQATVLYASSGHVLIQTALGTNQIWVAAALAGSALLIERQQPAASALVQAISACTTKLLALLFWPVLWLCTPRRGTWLATCVLLTAGVFATFVLLGADVLDPLRREGEGISSGNLPYLLEPLSTSLGKWRYLPYDALAACTLAAAWLWMYWETRRWDDLRRARVLPAALALIGLLFMLFSKKSISGYEVFVMYPAILVLAGTALPPGRQITFLLVFNVLLVAEPSAWFRVGQFQPLSQWLQGAGVIPLLLFVLTDIALMACYAFLAWLSLRSIHVSGRDAGTANSESLPAILGATS